MKTLFVLEFKKLAKKRMNIIVIAVCLVLVGLLFALPVKQFIVLNTEGEQIMGTAAIAMERDFENAYAGELTNERITSDIAAYQALFDDPANVSQDSDTKALSKTAYFKHFFPYIDYWKLINLYLRIRNLFWRVSIRCGKCDSIFSIWKIQTGKSQNFCCFCI